MNEVLKQRLVGALILIALGVVFWPIIFVEPGDMSAALEKRIPPRPGVNVEQIPAPSATGLRKSPTLTPVEPVVETVETVVEEPVAEVRPQPAAKPAAKPAAVIPVKKTRSEAPQKPTLDANGVPVAWILQVASVSKPEKAEALRAQLLEMGHKAYVKKVHSGGGVLLRVYIGPKFERAKLDKIKSGVDGKFGVQSLVVRYVP